MAGLEGLESIIYHEKQQSGSMLCAQHALNSLLQGNYFTAADLSDIARNFDIMEASYDDNNAGNTSTNMDDTGFFSVQVLDNALKVWGLDLMRWRGQEMRPYQDHPHTQLAFILNYQQHWFTLRRFGPAVSNLEEDPGEGHWFNLNSFLPTPEWVGKTYLGMVLQQAEADGYSVFAVTQQDPSAPLSLPRTDADEIASTLLEPSAIRPTTQLLSRHVIHEPLPATESALNGDEGQPQSLIEGFEDEDMELQAALQASLTGGPLQLPQHHALTSFPPPPAINAYTPMSPLFGSAPGSGSHTPSAPDLPNNADIDPLQASRERNRALLERMRAEQETAQRELWADNDGMRRNMFARGRLAGDREEEELVRRAIAESEAIGKIERLGDPDSEEGGDIDIAEDSSRIPLVGSTRGGSNSYPVVERDRVYDDDDAELQAALKASLEHIPDGWIAPKLSTPTRPAAPLPPVPTSQSDAEERASEVESVTSDGEATTSSDAVRPETEAVSVEELRKKRLAFLDRARTQ